MTSKYSGVKTIAKMAIPAFLAAIAPKVYGQAVQNKPDTLLVGKNTICIDTSTMIYGGKKYLPFVTPKEGNEWLRRYNLKNITPLQNEIKGLQAKLDSTSMLLRKKSEGPKSSIHYNPTTNIYLITRTADKEPETKKTIPIAADLEVGYDRLAGFNVPFLETKFKIGNPEKITFDAYGKLGFTEKEKSNEAYQDLPINVGAGVGNRLSWTEMENTKGSFIEFGIGTEVNLGKGFSTGLETGVMIESLREKFSKKDYFTQQFSVDDDNVKTPIDDKKPTGYLPDPTETNSSGTSANVNGFLKFQPKNSKFYGKTFGGYNSQHGVHGGGTIGVNLFKKGRGNNR